MLLFTGAPPRAALGGLVRTSVRRIRTAMYPIWIQLGYNLDTWRALRVSGPPLFTLLCWLSV